MTKQIPDIPEKPVKTEENFEKQHNKNYLKVVLLVILGLIIVSGVVCTGIQNVRTTKTHLTSISDETANWKTYTDEVNKFTIKYPKEWREEVRGDKLILLTPESIDLKDGQIGGIFINIVTNPSNLSSREYLDQVAIPAQKGSPCEGNIKIISNLPKSLKSLDVTIAEGFCGALDQGPQMFISKGDNIIILSSSLNNLDRNIVNQIYATFKFVDQTQSSETSNWKTYTNSEAKFSINYPPDWTWKIGTYHYHGV